MFSDAACGHINTMPQRAHIVGTDASSRYASVMALCSDSAGKRSNHAQLCRSLPGTGCQFGSKPAMSSTPRSIFSQRSLPTLIAWCPISGCTKLNITFQWGSYGGQRQRTRARGGGSEAECVRQACKQRAGTSAPSAAPAGRPGRSATNLVRRAKMKRPSTLKSPRCGRL